MFVADLLSHSVLLNTVIIIPSVSRNSTLQVQQTHIVSMEQLIEQNQAGMGSFSRSTVLRNKQEKSISAPIMVGLLSLANNLPSNKKLMFIRARAKSRVQGVHGIN